MQLKTFINFSQTTPEGKVIKKKRVRARSMVANFVDIIYIYFASATLNINRYDTGAASAMSYSYLDNQSALGSAGNQNAGIVVGTGSTAVAIGDYQLDTAIAHGTGAGQLSHGTTTVTVTPTTDGGKRYFRISRAFTNSSGGDITINEIGLVVNYSSYIYLLEHSLSTYTITNGNVGTVEYEFSITI